MKMEIGCGARIRTSTDGGTSTSGTTSETTVDPREKRTTWVGSIPRRQDRISCFGSPPITAGPSTSSRGSGLGSRVGYHTESYLYLEVQCGRRPAPIAVRPPSNGGECLSRLVRSSRRAPRGETVRRIRPRLLAGRLSPVHRRLEDGPLRDGDLLVPLLLLPRVRREDVQGCRLRGRKTRDTGRRRPGRGACDSGDGRRDHRRRPARCRRAHLPLHPPPEG